MMRHGTVVLTLLCIGLLVSPDVMAAKPTATKPKIIDTATEFVGSDGVLVRYEPLPATKSGVGIQSATPPTEADLEPCLFITREDFLSFSCSMGDRKLGVTDWGIGYKTNLDAETPLYNLTWSSDGVTRNTTFRLNASECPPGNYYYDTGGPLAGDEICWGAPATVWKAHLYPSHPAGQYTFYRSTSHGLLPNDYATILPGTIEVISGNNQSTIPSQPAQAPLVLAIKNYRGETVSYPIDSRYPDQSNPVNFTIAGPNNSVGAAVEPSFIRPRSSTISVSLQGGNKVGTYTIDATTMDAAPLSPGAVLTVVSRKEPDDNTDKEEGNGENCSVADPITIGIGNSFQQEVDYAKTGLSLLEFVRSYNALGSKSRLMRNYWTTTFDRAVLPPTVAGQAYRVRRPDGLVIPFSYQNGQFASVRPYFHGVLRTSGSGWQYVTEDNVTETYDAQGRWISIVDAAGRSLTATYNNKGLLTKVVANTGEELTLTYNTYNQVATVTDHSDRVWAYVYNAYSNLTQVTDPDGLNHWYHYESPHSPYLLTGISIGYGTHFPALQYVAWEFDSSGRATSNYFLEFGDPTPVRRFDIVYNDVTGERAVIDPLQNTSIFATTTLNGRGFVDSVEGPGFASCGLADSVLERDVNKNVVKRTEFGRSIAFGDYDAKGQYGFMIEGVDTPSARRSDYLYDPRFIGKPTQITQPSVSSGRNKVTQIEYDAAGNVLQKTTSGFRPDGTPVSRTVSMQYSGPYGQVSQFNGPRTDANDTTLFEYNATTQRLMRVTDPNGIRLRDNITYTLTGHIAAEDRPNGLRLTYAYYPGTDLLKSVTETSGSGFRTTTWTYTAWRLVSGLTISDGINADLVTNFTYNRAGDLLEISSPGAGRIRYTLDAAGNRKQDTYFDSQGAQRRWIQRTFDGYGRVEDLINPGGTTHYEVHPDGTTTSMLDGRSNTTSYTYDDFKRLTQIVQPGQISSAFAYDVEDRLTRVTDGNQALTTITYDDLGNQIRLESPDTGTESRVHDGAGNLVASTDALGQATTYVYDAVNRVTSIDRSGVADDETYVYDNCTNGAGKLCQTTNGIGDFVSYEYDALGRVTKQTTNAGSVGYKYNAADDITEIVYPSARAVRYAYNANRQVTGVSVVDGGNQYVLARNVDHLPFGPVTTWIYGNGAIESRQYDLQYRPTSITSGSHSTVAYGGYDGNSNLTQRTVNGDAQSMTYDALDRLWGATGGFGSRVYEYDAVGNRTSLMQDGSTVTYSYQAQSNRLLSDSQWTYDRDGNGNETRRQTASGQGWDLTYTAKDRLLGVTDLQNPGTLLGGYRYNSLGQRTAKASAYGDSLYAFGLSGELLAEVQPGGAVTQEYVYLDGAPLALLGAPTAPDAPFGLDQFIDNPASDPNCTSKNSSAAFNGKYLQCPSIYPSNFGLSWPWTPPYTGDYHIYVRWAWQQEGGQCYRFQGGQQNVCVGANEPAGIWLSLGQHHLVANVNQPSLTTYENGLQTLKMDAVRYVLVHKDVTDRDYKYVHTDALGTPLRVSNKSNVVVWAAAYDPFGTATVNDDPDGDTVRQVLNLRFPGQYFDSETGLHYNYFRNYDPANGRYLESDPIGLEGGLNTYAYVGGNPVMWVDPLGLEVSLCSQPAFGLPYGVDHQWIKTDTREAGMGTARAGGNAGNQSGDRYGDPVQVTDHTGRSNEPNASCKEVKGVDEAKVNAQLEIGHPLGAWTYDNQCRTFTTQVLWNARTSDPRIDQSRVLRSLVPGIR